MRSGRVHPTRVGGRAGRPTPLKTDRRGDCPGPRQPEAHRVGGATPAAEQGRGDAAGQQHERRRLRGGGHDAGRVGRGVGVGAAVVRRDVVQVDRRPGPGQDPLRLRPVPAARAELDRVRPHLPEARPRHRRGRHAGVGQPREEPQNHLLARRPLPRGVHRQAEYGVGRLPGRAAVVVHGEAGQDQVVTRRVPRRRRVRERPARARHQLQQRPLGHHGRAGGVLQQPRVDQQRHRVRPRHPARAARGGPARDDQNRDPLVHGKPRSDPDPPTPASRH